MDEGHTGLGKEGDVKLPESPLSSPGIPRPAQHQRSPLASRSTPSSTRISRTSTSPTNSLAVSTRTRGKLVAPKQQAAPIPATKRSTKAPNFDVAHAKLSVKKESIQEYYARMEKKKLELEQSKQHGLPSSALSSRKRKASDTEKEEASSASARFTKKDSRTAPKRARPEKTASSSASTTGAPKTLRLATEKEGNGSSIPMKSPNPQSKCGNSSTLQRKQVFAKRRAFSPIN